MVFELALLGGWFIDYMVPCFRLRLLLLTLAIPGSTLGALMRRQYKEMCA